MGVGVGESEVVGVWVWVSVRVRVKVQRRPSPSIISSFILILLGRLYLTLANNNSMQNHLNNTIYY